MLDNMIALTYTLTKDEIAFFLNKYQEVISQYEVHYQGLLENIAQVDQPLLGDITPFTNTLTDYHTSLKQEAHALLENMRFFKTIQALA